MTTFASYVQNDRAQVLSVLDAAGERGASHEDFVEAGLARGYSTVLRDLVDAEGFDIRVDFTTGAARWALRAQPDRGLRAA